MQHFSNVSIKYFHLTHKGRPNFKRFLQSFKRSSKAKFQKIFAIIQKQSKTRTRNAPAASPGWTQCPAPAHSGSLLNIRICHLSGRLPNPPYLLTIYYYVILLLCIYVYYTPVVSAAAPHGAVALEHPHLPRTLLVQTLIGPPVVGEPRVNSSVGRCTDGELMLVLCYLLNMRIFHG